jgi:hypothetical protein
MTSIIIVEKGGSLKALSVKEYQETELFKKCGFKKADGFLKQTEWTIKMSGSKYIVAVYGKTEGKANGENKYDFPPPIDNVLFFGSCALVCSKVEGDTSSICNLTLELWEKMYEKLFGGFEDLAATCAEDEAEIDELENVPKEKKTKQGYLKDGFVVDSSDADDDDDDDEDDDGTEEYDDENEDDEVDNNDLVLEDIGSELDEEDYDYSSDEP